MRGSSHLKPVPAEDHSARGKRRTVDSEPGRLDQKSTMSGMGKIVKMTKMSEGGLIMLDHDAWYKMLMRPEIGNKPIAVVSIAGGFRSGKSFMLSFLLRYLKMEGWHNKDWMGSNDTVLDKNIKWRGGQEPETTGIDIFNEVFTVKRSNGEEVALLLMDTQGLFDNRTKEANNTILFIFSALASSVQIYNIQNLIKENELQNLQMCVQYAMKAARTGTKNFEFQKLIFLIRDWMQENEYGLEGGEEYLKKVLADNSNVPELNMVRRNLRGAFKSLECFLMPEPNSKVRRFVANFLGRNKDIGEEFLEFTAIFAEHVLRPDTILTKAVAGKPMLAKELLNMLAACDGLFASGSIKIESMLEASTKAHYSTACEESLIKYDDTMKVQVSGKKALAEQDLQKHHIDASKIALEHYNDNSDDERDKVVRERYRSHLEEQCKEHFKLVKLQNKAIMDKMEVALYEAADEYEKEMQQINPSGCSIKDDILQSFHDKISKKVLSKYGDAADSQKLVDKIKACFEKEVTENKRKREEEEKMEADRVELELYKAKVRSCEDYKTEMDKMLQNYPTTLSLKEFHEKKKNEKKMIYSQDFSKTSPKFQQYLLQLELDLGKIYEEAVIKNERNRENADRKVKSEVQLALSKYKSEKQEQMRGCYIEEDDLERSNKEFKAKALELTEGRSDAYIRSRIDECKEYLEQQLSAVFNEMALINERNEQNRNVKRNAGSEENESSCLIL